ncbi:protein phosphatase 1H-like isoform X1 [Haliotis asinina]|uniref:protein phosphatase 1H-like isoform X1 n=1 Tax=Haliotis asinina TaxID=109174 RepID=UPI0035326E18
MLSRLRTTLKSRKGSTIVKPDYDKLDTANLPDKFAYSRPRFLNIDDSLGSDHSVRAILTPLDLTALPWSSGYAECVNGGKSRYNEDQAAASQFYLSCGHHTSNGSVTNNNRPKPPNSQYTEVMVTYMGIFDGHAGTGAALTASHLLETHLQEKLTEVKENILELEESEIVTPLHSAITADRLIVGALEAAFCSLDEQMARERTTFAIRGGCTALVAIFLLNTLYVANAGDCRAILSINDEIVPMSRELCPGAEMQRLQTMAFSNPGLLRNEFSNRSFCRRIWKEDIGKKVLCKEPMSEGWVYREVTSDDIRSPLVRGEGKKSRLMDTIGVSRCLGDHDLLVFGTDIRIKPFLIPLPEVKTFNFNKTSLTENDVLIMGSDGLWDVMSNQDAVSIVKAVLQQHTTQDPLRYTIAAKALVAHSRGTASDKGWRMDNDEDASFDDITAFVIPLHMVKKVGIRL